MTVDYKQIILAIDGSDQAEYAFRKSIEIAKWNNAVLNLIHVVDASTYIAITKRLPDTLDDSFEYGKRLLDFYKKKALTAGLLEVNVFITIGSPKRIISQDFAKRLEADLIVCGAQGLHTVEHFFMGSVSQYIVRSSHCDVLVVRRG